MSGSSTAAQAKGAWKHRQVHHQVTWDNFNAISACKTVFPALQLLLRQFPSLPLHVIFLGKCGNAYSDPDIAGTRGNSRHSRGSFQAVHQEADKLVSHPSRLPGTTSQRRT